MTVQEAINALLRIEDKSLKVTVPQWFITQGAITQRLLIADQIQVENTNDLLIDNVGSEPTKVVVISSVSKILNV